MAEKGHTELPWRRSDSQTSMYGSEIVANTKVKSKRVVCRLGGPDREENTDLILAAVNTYPAVEGLVKALELATGALQKLPSSEDDIIKFTGEWSDYGSLSVSQILDSANSALASIRGGAQ